MKRTKRENQIKERVEGWERFEVVCFFVRTERAGKTGLNRFRVTFGERKLEVRADKAKVEKARNDDTGWTARDEREGTDLGRRRGTEE